MMRKKVEGITLPGAGLHDIAMGIPPRRSTWTSKVIKLPRRSTLAKAVKACKIGGNHYDRIIVDDIIEDKRLDFEAMGRSLANVIRPIIREELVNIRQEEKAKKFAKKILKTCNRTRRRDRG